MKPGAFITFEGGEGTGKSTQAARLAEHLRAMGQNTLLTREPGGTPQGESLRRVLVSGDPAQWSAASEAMLMAAAREVHVRTVIAPALQASTTVICDRFMDSTRVYQGHAGGAAPELIAVLERAAVGDCLPDLTLVFDLAPEAGLARARLRPDTGEDRFEQKGFAFHTRLREGFRNLVAAEPGRCKLIDASQTPDQVFRQILHTIGIVPHV